MEAAKLNRAHIFTNAIFAILFGLLFPVTTVFAASEEITLYTFCSLPGCVDGAQPNAGLIFDAAGNLYSTTWLGGTAKQGTVFELSPGANGTWTETVLHDFCESTGDGCDPLAGLIFDAAGNLYGTTSTTVFELTPGTDGSWNEETLYTFTGPDGGPPWWGSLIFDSAGNLYGTTEAGGTYAHGTVFELTPVGNGSWNEKVLHNFKGGKVNRGVWPYAGLILDAAGNLYGTTEAGGTGHQGTVFELSPGANGTWRYKVLYNFKNAGDGASPTAGLIFDAAGNLYGTTNYGGFRHDGTVFELSPGANGKWREKVLASIWGIVAGVIFDSAGNLYGTTGAGIVFELTPAGNGKWNEEVLYTFPTDESPSPGSLIFDSAGNLYGTTLGNGTTTFGTAYEIVP